MNFKIAVLPGDGIGPEVTLESVKLLEAIGRKYGHTFNFEHGAVGGNAIDGIAELLATNPVKIYAHKAEADGVKKVTGVSDNDLVRVESGDDLRIGDVSVEFLHTPGHTPGSQCFRIKNTLVSGDTLFINGCGRVDLPGSDSEDMFRSMRKLADLPDETLLLPGHNYAHVPNATMGDTKKLNVHMQVKDLDAWRMMMG